VKVSAAGRAGSLPRRHAGAGLAELSQWLAVQHKDSAGDRGRAEAGVDELKARPGRPGARWPAAPGTGAPSAQAPGEFMTGPRRQTLAGERDRVIAKTEIIEVQLVQPEPGQ
jgi:hypothetical protein